MGVSLDAESICFHADSAQQDQNAVGVRGPVGKAGPRGPAGPPGKDASCQYDASQIDEIRREMKQLEGFLFALSISLFFSHYLIAKTDI